MTTPTVKLILSTFDIDIIQVALSKQFEELREERFYRPTMHPSSYDQKMDDIMRIKDYLNHVSPKMRINPMPLFEPFNQIKKKKTNAKRNKLVRSSKKVSKRKSK